MEREKAIRLEQEKKREETLAKKRFKLPKIIVTQYEEFEIPYDDPEQSSRNERQSVLPSLVNIPCGAQNQNEKGRDESDSESQTSKGDTLELPELESSAQEVGHFEDIKRADERYESILPELEQKTVETVTDVTESISQEMGPGSETAENVASEDKGVENGIEGDISQSDVPIEPKNDVVAEDLAMKIDEQNVLNTEHETVDMYQSSSQEQQEQNNAAANVSSTKELVEAEQLNETGQLEKIGTLQKTGQLQEKESQSRVEEKDGEPGEDTEQTKEIQMNFLAPPSVPVMAGENGSVNDSIGDADDTGNLYC